MKMNGEMDSEVPFIRGYILEELLRSVFVGGNGSSCLIMSDHLLLWWLWSKVRALMLMKAYGEVLEYSRLLYSSYLLNAESYSLYSKWIQKQLYNS